MAFNYQELTRIKGKIEEDKNSLISLLNSFSDLVDANVNNQKVWYGTSSDSFKTDYDTFEGENYKAYKDGFEKQITVVGTTIEEWRKAEQ